jgi:negative regulator of genetic competence, sporulation and motility
MLSKIRTKGVNIMTIDKVANNKLKVQITNVDLLERTITPESLQYNSAEAQRLFGDVIAVAKEQHGFEAYGSNLVVEASPMTDDGMQVTLTMVDDAPESAWDNYGNTNAVIKLEKLMDALPLVETLSPDYKFNSQLFRLNGVYYLVLNAEQANVAMYEYGELIEESDVFYGYLREYGDMVVNDFFKRSCDIGA